MNDRILRVQQQIRRLLSEFLLKEGNFSIGIISINDILVSRDLSTVKIWVSFIAEQDQEQAFQKLLRHSNKAQTFLYKNLPVKKVPKILWQLDTKPDLTYRLEKILDDLRRASGTDRDISESNPDGTEDPDRFPP